MGPQMMEKCENGWTKVPKTRRIAVVALGVLFVYYEIYRWIPMGRWNGEANWPVHNDQFYPDIVIGLLLVWMISNFWRGRRVAMWVGVGLLTLWVVVHLSDWWIPYIVGTGPERADFYRFYSSRIQLLPSFGRHRPPDGGHAVLDGFVFLALASCLWASLKRVRIESR